MPSERIQLLKAHATRFSKDEVMAVLDTVGGEYFRRGSAEIQGEVVQVMVDGLAQALRQIPADARVSLQALVRSF
ncbi:MAG: hypothetical protein H7338_09065 [Candidatus Sericytochromatia bacterium]|nr:hypothetical protein [Candidatus Sericytochromatia bacterium]